MSNLLTLSLLPPSFKLITSLICLTPSLNQCLIIWSINIFQITSILIIPTSLSSILMAQFYPYQLDILSTYLNYTFDVYFSNNLPPLSFSYTAEFYAILEVLLFILNLASNNYLIASNSMLCL